MLPISENVSLIIKNDLEELGCCKRCILRYLGYSNYDDGTDVFLTPKSQSIFNTNNDGPVKKPKLNPCRACLDILNDSTLQSFLDSLPEGYNDYEMIDFDIIVASPMAILIRERSLFIYLKEKFPEVYKDVQLLNIQIIKPIFKSVCSNIISQKINKLFRKGSNFQVNIKITYEDETEEIRNVSKLDTKKISKTVVIELLKNCTDAEFKQNFPIPPNIQNKATTASITYDSSYVYVGGRYLKFSRDMGHTPFVVNDVAITESSVQDTLFDGICKILKCDRQILTFSASGREDADTRMIGDGRPFYIQIVKPKFDNVTPEQCRAIEEAVLESNAVVLIRFQMISPNDLRKIKFGEQEKSKHYRALCITHAPNIPQVLQAINLLKCPIKINQATPIRVLHRRTQMIRERNIYDIKATKVEDKPNLFYLDLITQAGTYVKEFVHGDFNRTNPNLTQVIGFPTDVVALDVTAVELEWPM